MPTPDARNLRVALIHGDVPDEERANLRRRFALPKEDADAIDVLLSSEVGCEGLDFQFCDLLVNYDLPGIPCGSSSASGVSTATASRARPWPSSTS